MKILWPGTFPEKTSKFDRFSMPKQEARKGRKEVFAWYLLRFKRFRRVTKFNGKWTSKCHEKSMEIDTSGHHWGGLLRFGWFLEDLEFSVFYNFFGRSKNQQKSVKNRKMKRKRCQGRRARTAAAWRANPGKVYRALRGGPPWKKNPKRREVFGGPWIFYFWMTFRSIPKPTKISNQSKNEAKAIPREAQSQKGSVSPGLGKVCRTLRGLSFYQCFQFRWSCFSLCSKAEEVKKSVSKTCQKC